MTDNNDILEEQIGSLGSDLEENLGKLKHVGKTKRDLTDSENDAKSSFLERSNSRMVFGQNHTEAERENSIKGGWIPIDRSRLGVRDQFYPEDWEFRIKPATVEAIKNWSSIDEDNMAVTNNVFNEVIKSCVSINTPLGKLPWGKMNSWDRFWFILMIREYTFVKGEAALNYDEDCPECGANIMFDLNPDALVYEFPDEEVVEKHWSAKDRMWVIDPREYDVDGPIVNLYVPTLEKDEMILQWAYAQSQLGKTINEPFLRFLPWLIAKCNKEYSVFEKYVKEAKREFDSWDTDMFSFMDEVLRNITVNPSEKLKQTCYNCGEEVRTAVRFPNGIKHIFAIQSKHRKFGSK